jgi:formiminotetrahydrofolate cyclodeaminase
MSLVGRSVREFVDSVGSAGEPVPAGGSVAALTGASSAALLALVCGVLERKQSVGVSSMLARARDLQERLLALVDEDADAFRAYLQARRTAGAGVEEALNRTTQTPLDIAAACAEVVNLSRAVERQTRGPMLSDVRTARALASAALGAALDIGEQDVHLHADVAAQARLRDQIRRLRDATASPAEFGT